MSEFHLKGSAEDSQKVTLVFDDVCVTLGKNDILRNVWGRASVGQMLAIMGPSGAGKSTLLNAITGRIKFNPGVVTLNGKPVSRHLRRKISYVLQQDVFFHNLTLSETLTFTTLLRLPQAMPHQLKLQRMDEIVTALELHKCLNIRMGGPLVTGLSGGERKRASIACELLTNPSVLILDEPTSGLDSAIAFSLMSSLERYSRLSMKTVIATIHQPSSQIFHMFANLLLMNEGQVAYFGPSGKVLEFFSNIGLHCAPHYNPADFILDQVKMDEKIRQRTIEEAENLKLSYTSVKMTKCKNNEVGLFDGQSVTKDGSSIDDSNSDIVPSTDRKSFKNQHNNQIKRKHISDNEGVKLNELKAIDSEVSELGDDDSSRALNEVDVDKYAVDGAKFPTGFLSQYVVLTRRAFVQSRSRMLSKLCILQMLFLAFFTGALWFQTERTEETASDRLALVFCIVIYAMFTPMVDRVQAFF